jgi:lipid A 3-O-deacylase
MRFVRLGWFVRLTVVMGVLVAVSAGPTHAEDLRWIDEGKVGVLAHDIRFLGNHVEPGADVTVEVLFPSPAFLHGLGGPRPHLGIAVNTAGATDYGYGGLTWRGRPWRPLLTLPDGLFVAGSLGGASHDGHRNTAPSDRKLLGSRLLFRESVEGGYQLTRDLNVSVVLDHVSNAELARHNQGLTNLGARVGFTF